MSLQINEEVLRSNVRKFLILNENKKLIETALGYRVSPSDGRLIGDFLKQRISTNKEGADVYTIGGKILFNTDNVILAKWIDPVVSEPTVDPATKKMQPSKPVNSNPILVIPANVKGKISTLLLKKIQNFCDDKNIKYEQRPLIESNLPKNIELLLETRKSKQIKGMESVLKGLYKSFDCSKTNKKEDYVELKFESKDDALSFAGSFKLIDPNRFVGIYSNEKRTKYIVKLRNENQNTI